MKYKYPLGAFRNPPVPEEKKKEYATLSVLPPKVITDISMLPVLDQGQIGSCVGHAVATTINYDYFKKTGTVPNSSARWNYAVGKMVDGNTNEGTCAYSVFKGIQNHSGSATVKTVPDDISLSPLAYTQLVPTVLMLSDAKQYPIDKEVEISNPTCDQLKSLINQYGVISIALDVDEITWMEEDGQYSLKPGTAGGHEIALYGYEVLTNGDTKFYIRNSWNTGWGQMGNGTFLWSDYQGNVYDAMAFVVNTTPAPTTLPTVQITRSIANLKEIMGSLTVNIGSATFSCKTLELPWLNNALDVSCIPPGTYQAKWAFMPSHNVWHYLLSGVPGRDGIFIHSGNFATGVQIDTKGCILLGNLYGDLDKNSQPDILNSKLTVQAFERFMNKEPFILVVK